MEERGDGTATAVSQPISEANPEEESLIRGWLLDPAEWRIVGKVNCRRWMTYDERWLYYYKADLVRRDRSDLDLETFCSRIIRRSPAKARTAEGTHALVVNLADWQVGKDPIPDTHQRLADMIGRVEDRLRDLRKMGVVIVGMFVHGLGDLGESCAGQYPQQQFRVTLNQREQRKLIRWALDSALDSWQRKVSWIAVKAVGGNHGEERLDGKSYTDFADNRDVAVFEDLAFAYAKNDERYGHVSFALPNDDLTLTYEHEGIIVGLAHSHQAGFASGQADPAKKIETWWRGQMAGQQPIGDADILNTGHYHHPWVRTIGKRTHFGCPALDGGSDWWRHRSGLDSPPGTLTYVLGPDSWSHFEIL